MKELFDRLYLCIKHKHKDSDYNCKLFKSYESLINYSKNYNIENGYIISIEDDTMRNIDDYLIKKKLQDSIVKKVNIISNL
jgi:hypothetical protein